jgi:hypothetical protein
MVIDRLGFFAFAVRDFSPGDVIPVLARRGDGAADIRRHARLGLG